MRSESDRSILNLLYRGTTTIENFCWDNMTTTPLLCLMTYEDIEYIRKIITSPRYSGNNRLKMSKIDEVMHFRGFTKFAGGTNRIVYTHPSASNAVFKVAIDSVGINDNPAEFRNQEFLKPYCCKVFECSPCGTIASFEKVERITTFEEFYTIAEDYFYMLSRVVLGKYVMEDIGIDYFMNVGIRRGFGVVLLDFPYLFELDGGKLECVSVLDDNSICHGEIDYDHGLNKLICNKCGRIYRARDLAKTPKDNSTIVCRKGGRKMKIRLMQGSKVLKTIDTEVETNCFEKPETVIEDARKPSYDDAPRVRIVTETVIVEDEKKAASNRSHKIDDDRIERLAGKNRTKIVVESVSESSVETKKEYDKTVITASEKEEAVESSTVEEVKEEPQQEKVDVVEVPELEPVEQPVENNDTEEEEPVLEIEDEEEEEPQESNSTEEVTSVNNEEQNDNIDLEAMYNNQFENVQPSQIDINHPEEQIYDQEEEEEYEDEDEIKDILILDTKPLDENMEINVAYCISFPGVNISAYQDSISQLSDIDTDIFALYIKNPEDKKVYRYIIDKDTGELQYYEDISQEEEESRFMERNLGTTSVNKIKEEDHERHEDARFQHDEKPVVSSSNNNSYTDGDRALIEALSKREQLKVRLETVRVPEIDHEHDHEYSRGR